MSKINIINSFFNTLTKNDPYIEFGESFADVLYIKYTQYKTQIETTKIQTQSKCKQN